VPNTAVVLHSITTGQGPATPESYTELVSSLLVWAPDSSTAETLEPHPQVPSPSDPEVQHHTLFPQDLEVQAPQPLGPPRTRWQGPQHLPTFNGTDLSACLSLGPDYPRFLLPRTQEHGGRHGAGCSPEARAQAHCPFSLQACLPTQSPLPSQPNVLDGSSPPQSLSIPEGRTPGASASLRTHGPRALSSVIIWC